MSGQQSKADRIAEAQANLPLPEDPPVASDVRTFQVPIRPIPCSWNTQSQVMYSQDIPKIFFLQHSFPNYSWIGECWLPVHIVELLWRSHSKCQGWWTSGRDRILWGCRRVYYWTERASYCWKLEVVLDSRMVQIWVVLEDRGSRLRRALMFYLLSTAKTLYCVNDGAKIEARDLYHLLFFRHIDLWPKSFPLRPSAQYIKFCQLWSQYPHFTGTARGVRKENAFCGDVIVVDLKDDVETPQRLTCKVFM
jgi:hypothetical protein